MSEIDEMLVRIERAIEYYEKNTDDIGMPIFLRDIANVITLLKIAEQGAGSMLLDLQQDCIKERQRAEAAANECDRLREKLAKCCGDLMIADQRVKAAEKALQAIIDLPSVDGLTETERTQQELRLIEQARRIATAALEAKP